MKAACFRAVVFTVTAFAALSTPVRVSAALPFSRTGAIAKVHWPSDLQVSQRGNDDLGRVYFLGELTSAATVVQVRATVRPGGNGRGIPWQALDSFHQSGRRFVGSVRLRAGGWYWVEARAVNRGVAGRPFPIGRVGVGEVFLTAGQSNAVNTGELERGLVVNPRVSVFNGSRWVVGANPLPFDQGDGGSPWPYMANQLVTRLNVPVGIYPLGLGATSISQWQQGQSIPQIPGFYLFDRLTQGAINIQFRGGARAVLWHQGESDRLTPIEAYRDRLTNLITQLRAVSGVDIPWVIALASYIPGDRPLRPGESPVDPSILPQTVRLAQYEVCRTVPNCYVGPTTDDLGPDFRFSPEYPIHLSTIGLAIHGQRWADVLLGPGSPIPADLRKRTR